MADTLDFAAAAFAQGAASFASGVTLDNIIIAMNYEIERGAVNQGRDGSDADHQEWWLEKQEADQRACGLLLGYLSGVVEAIRRIDQRPLASPSGPTESK